MATKPPSEQLIVVTGATGRLGQRVVASLLEKGYKVRGVDIKAERRPPSEAELELWGPVPEHPVTVADMCDPTAAAAAVAGADGLVHMGAIPGPASEGVDDGCD